MKFLLLSICCAATFSMTACVHKSGSTEHSCQHCTEGKAEKKDCGKGECSLDKKCSDCDKKKP